MRRNLRRASFLVLVGIPPAALGASRKPSSVKVLIGFLDPPRRGQRGKMKSERHVEAAPTGPRPASLEALRLALEAAGIEFIFEAGEATGVKLGAR